MTDDPQWRTRLALSAAIAASISGLWVHSPFYHNDHVVFNTVFIFLLATVLLGIMVDLCLSTWGPLAAPRWTQHRGE